MVEVSTVRYRILGTRALILDAYVVSGKIHCRSRNRCRVASQDNVQMLTKCASNVRLDGIKRLMRFLVLWHCCMIECAHHVVGGSPVAAGAGVFCFWKGTQRRAHHSWMYMTCVLLRVALRSL